jgi:hypothetical protein
MSQNIRVIRVTVLLVTTVVAAALIGRAEADPVTVGLFIFGLVNAVFAPPGTMAIRLIAIGCTVAALVSPVQLRVLVALLAWLIWLPAFLVAWSTSRHPQNTPEQEMDRSPEAPRAQIAVAAIIGAVALASIAYRVVFAHGLQQSAALFLGIPTLLAILVVVGVSPRSAVGVACKAVTVGLLVSVIFLGEGFLCVAMAAPLFYGVAVLIGYAADARRRVNPTSHTALSFLALLALVPMSLEGVTDGMSLNRDESVSATRVVHASPQDVAHALFEPPRFDRMLPLYLRAGFPRPTVTRVERHGDKDQWVVRFLGGETRLNGTEPRAGDLTLELEQVEAGFVRWRAISDDSHMTHFLAWRESSVRWVPIDAQTTRVTWTLRYRRSLDPSWYFGPWERYATRLAAGYLIDSVATP